MARAAAEAAPTAHTQKKDRTHTVCVFAPLNVGGEICRNMCVCVRVYETFRGFLPDLCTHR